jgi:flagellin
MPLTITNKVASLTAQTNLGRSQSMLTTSLERLSTGLKINRGADGPAALVISEQQRAQISGIQTAIANTQKAVAMVQTTEGSLNEINNLLVQARSLALDSANSGVVDSNALQANQTELTNVLATIDRIASNTQFGTKKVLDGSAGFSGSTDDADVTFMRATTESPTGTFAVNITTAASRATTTAGTTQSGVLAADETLTINGVSISLKSGQSQAQVISTINTYTGQTGVTAVVSGGGATQLYTTQFGSAAKLNVQSNVAAAATSSGFGTTQASVVGVDVAGTIGGFAASGTGNILTGNTGAGAAGISIAAGLAAGSTTASVTGAQGNVTVNDNSLVFQIGANAYQTVKVAVSNASTKALGLNVAGSQFANLAAVDVRSQSGAQDAIRVIDQAINDITNQRGYLGAIQSQTLQSGADNLQTALTNTTAAESVIRDTDFAAETANYAKSQVLLQVGTTVLQNSNQMSQLVLNLLRG